MAWRSRQRSNGSPLALELAAARLKLLSLEQISARLDDRFQLLTGGSRTAVPRQQTLRATIDWSYDLLTGGERRLLRQLAVFAGGFALEVAEQVCGGSNASDGATIELLSNLIDKSLVVVDDQDGERRYRLLETVRQYARDRLFESGEAEGLRDRHFHFFERLALEAEPALLGPDHVAWARRLGADHDNLRAALEWGLARPGDIETSFRMVCALWSFWNQRNYFSEGRQWVERALSAAPDPPPSLRIRALLAGADLSFLSGDYAAARAFCNDVLALDDAGLGKDRWPVAFASFLLGNLAHGEGEVAKAQELFERAVAIARASDAPHIMGLVLIGPVSIARLMGDYGRAMELIEESITRLRPAGKWMLATALTNLCDVALCLGRLEQAEEAGREGVTYAHETADTRAMTWCLATLARSAVLRNRLNRAARLWGAAEGLSESIGAPLPTFIRGRTEADLAGVRQALGDVKFGAAWTEGRQLTPDAAFEYALQDDDAP